MFQKYLGSGFVVVRSSEIGLSWTYWKNALLNCKNPIKFYKNYPGKKIKTVGILSMLYSYRKEPRFTAPTEGYLLH